MAKILAIIFLLYFLLPVSTTAQPYKSIFGDSSMMWTATDNGLAINSAVFEAKTDTVVNSLNYKIVYFDYNHPGDIPLGLLREDTLTGQIWYRSLPNKGLPQNPYNFPTDTVDKLVMDMGLQIGDTFIFGSTAFIADTQVVDTIYHVGGLKHIEFNDNISFNTTTSPVTFIESLGTPIGFAYKDSNILFRQPYNPYPGRLICIYKDSVKVYSTPLINQYNGACIPPASIESHSKDIPVLISPNPTTGRFTIKTRRIDYTFSIINVEGQIVHSGKGEKGRDLEINLDLYPKGIYILRLTTINDVAYTRLVLH